MTVTVGPPGVLLAIEGIDGAGKTTQVGMLASRLEAFDLGVVRTKEPTNGSWGKLIRESAAKGRLSPQEELKAFHEDRRQHVESVIRPALAAGQIVIIDRYYFSTAAYQGSRGMDPDAIMAENETFAPAPDLLVILDVEPAVGLQRVAARGDQANLFEREDDLKKAAAIFAGMQRQNLLRIDGTKTRDEITGLILGALYHGPLFHRMCLKAHYKEECEPAYFSYRISGECKYVNLGQLAPVLAASPVREKSRM